MRGRRITVSWILAWFTSETISKNKEYMQHVNPSCLSLVPSRSYKESPGLVRSQYNVPIYFELYIVLNINK